MQGARIYSPLAEFPEGYYRHHTGALAVMLMITQEREDPSMENWHHPLECSCLCAAPIMLGTRGAILSQVGLWLLVTLNNCVHLVPLLFDEVAMRHQL